MTIKPSCAVLILSGVFFLEGKAANCPVPGPVMVSEVTFSQGTPLTNDYVDAQGVPVPMVGTHWVDQVNNANSAIDFPDGHPDEVTGVAKPNNVKSYAYSYVSNKSPKVGAVFKWLGAVPALPEGKRYWAEGVVISTPNCAFTLPLRELAGDTTYPATVSDQTIVLDGPNRKIQAYVTPNRKVDRKDAAGKNYADSLVPVTIEWTVYKIGKEPGNIVGKSCSTHTIYVTWDEPSTALRQETLFHLACVTANDQSASDVITRKASITKIWNEFTDQTVLRMDSDPLTYWDNVTKLGTDKTVIAAGNVAYLLNTKDGTCECWAKFFKTCTQVHGFNDLKVVTIDPYEYNQNILRSNGKTLKIAGFLVKQNINGQGPKVKPPYYFTNHSVVVFGDPFPLQNAQSIGASQSLIETMIFDPSYGKLSDSNRDWETDSLDGRLGYDVNNNNEQNLLPEIPGQQDATFTLSTDQH